MFENDMTLVYGFLVGMGVFVVVWFAFVAPSERRDHERRLRLVQKRIAEREERLNNGGEEDDDAEERSRAGS